MNETPPSSSSSLKVVCPILFGFFVMGFVDVVGVSSSYVKNDFGLSDSLANLIPMMVFLWFALFSIPTGIIMGKIGKRNTVAISLVLTAAAMLMPLFFYDFTLVLVGFALLGIGNTMLQVALNPMVAYVVSPNKLTSILTLGQFIKAISSFLGPILASAAAASFGNWKLIFAVYAVTSIISTLWLLSTVPSSDKSAAVSATFGSTLSLFKDKYITLLFFCILCIVGIDVGLNTAIPKLLMAKTEASMNQCILGTSIYFAARTAGAFFGTFLLARCSPLRFLKYSISIAIIGLILLMVLPSYMLMAVMIVIIGFFCSNIFSIIFSFALQHKPDRDNEISALMIMGVSGGAVVMPIMGGLSDAFGQVAGISVLLLCMLYIAFASTRIAKR